MSHTCLSFHRLRVQGTLNWVSRLDSQKSAIKASARLCSYLEAWPEKNLILNLLRLLLEKAMATHSSTLAWKIPWAEEPGGLPSMGSHRVRHDWGDLAAAAACHLCSLPWQPVPVGIWVCKVTDNNLLEGWERESESRSVVSNSLQPLGLYSPWSYPGQNTGVGSRSLLQGIFPTRGSNPGLLHGRWNLY